MQNVITLFSYDFVAIKYWFKSQTISKLLVIFGFTIVAFVTSLFFYGVSFAFFSLLFSYEDYGRLTANYLISATIVMTAWFGIGSSCASTMVFLFKPNKQIKYLLTLPLKPITLIVWMFVKTTAMSSVLLILVIAPVAASYAKIFILPSHYLYFIVRFIFALSILVIATNSIGAICAYLTAPLLQTKTMLISFIMAILFLVMGVILIKSIFPPSLTDLTSFGANEFNLIFNRLPLNNSLLPTGWISEMIVTGSIRAISSAILFAFLIFLLSISYQNRKFLPLFHSLRDKKNRQSQFSEFNFSSKFALIQKDWLSITRSWSELGYSIFLISMGIFFFLLLSQAHVERIQKAGFSLELTLFAFVWLIFFTTAFLLRFVFPLMAKEGTAGWYFFSLPLSRNKIVIYKIIIASVLTLPFLLMGVIVWYFLPFAAATRLYLIIASLSAILLLILIHSLLGAISPQFKLSHDPEKVSTSSMGMIAFFYSALITGIFTYELYLLLKFSYSPISALVVISLISTFLIFFLVVLAKNFKYEI